jgi:4-hydroxymandelate oxidase
MPRRRDTTTPYGFPIPSTSAPLTGIFNLHDFEALARDRLAPPAYGYYASGAGDERTVRDNLAAWSRWRLVPRVLSGTQAPDPGATLLGAAATLPVGIAPMALQGMAHPDGEVAMAAAAARAGVPFVLSTASTRTMEEVALAAPESSAPRWFQLYVERDLAFARELVLRAEAAGYGAIVLTVDLPVVGYRERDRRTGFAVPASVQAHLPPGISESDFGTHADAKPALRWDDVEEIASWTAMPLVVKGILSPRDVVRAVEHGARAVWLSNHGGRQLDGSVTAVEMLPEAVEAAAGRVEIYLDGGIRRGSDVLVALALGARGAFIGRPFLYALATAGEAGVAHAVAIIADEIARALTILGVASAAGVRREHVRPAP